MNLTDHFTLAELTVTSTGLKNEPTQEQVKNLIALCENILEPLRLKFGRPIKINSGYRSIMVNARVGGSATSSHCKAEAADLSCQDNAAIFHIIRQQLPFDQLIWEGGDDKQPDWVHVSFRRNGNNRKQVLKMKNGKYSSY